MINNGWKKFDETDEDSYIKQYGVPAATISETGVIRLNYSATQEYRFEKTETIVLWFNKDIPAIGIAKATDDTKASEIHHFNLKKESYSIIVPNFIVQYKLKEKAGMYPVKWNNEYSMLVIELNNPMPLRQNIPI
jgi:hypothetical protein